MDIKQYAYQQRRYLIVIAIVVFFFLVGLVKQGFAGVPEDYRYTEIQYDDDGTCGYYRQRITKGFTRTGKQKIGTSINTEESTNTYFSINTIYNYSIDSLIDVTHYACGEFGTTFSSYGSNSKRSELGRSWEYPWPLFTRTTPPDTSQGCNVPPPNPCEELTGKGAGAPIVDGAYQTKGCKNGCEFVNKEGWDTTTYFDAQLGINRTMFNWAAYTGEECPQGVKDGAYPEEDENPENPDEPFADSCANFLNQCNDACTYGMSSESFCDRETGDQKCVCNEIEELKPEETEEVPDTPAPIEETPDSPDASGGEQAVKDAIDRNTATQQGMQKTLDNLAKNQKATAENTGKLLDAMNSGALGKGISDGVAEGVANGMKGLGDDIAEGIEDGMGDLEGEMDGIGDLLGEIKNELSEPQYTQEPLPEAITADENYSFSDRTSEFLGQMKSTSLFSVVGGLDNLSGAGSPTYYLEGGETYGNHTFDMSDYDGALNKFKYFIHFLGLISAAGILILKR